MLFRSMGFLIWVFINCQYRVRIPGFLSNVSIVMVCITLFFFHAFADVRHVLARQEGTIQIDSHMLSQSMLLS